MVHVGFVMRLLCVTVCHDVFKGLEFTIELPRQNVMKFLDVEMYLIPCHTCWAYMMKGDKGLMSYHSGHSKLVKRSVAQACLSQSIKKSCDHMISKSLNVQVERLKASGFPDSIIVAIAEKMLCNMSTKSKKVGSEKQWQRPVVILMSTKNIA